MPLVSVTLTNYNYARYIGRAIESVLQQTYTDFELIIVDNASTDNSLEIIQRYARQDTRIKVIANPVNQGLVNSLIMATDAAQGTYCVHLDADDWVFAADAFARQVAMLDSDSEISFVYSPPMLCGEAGDQAFWLRYNEDQVMPGEVAVRDALKLQVPHSGPMFRMTAFRAFGGYNTEFCHATDMKLAIDLCGQGSVGYIDAPLYAFFQHTSSLSSTARAKDRVLEKVRAVASAFEGPLAPRFSDPARVRREALHHILLIDVSSRVFNNEYRAAAKCFVASAQVNFKDTVFQKQTLYLLLRMLLGDTGFKQLQRKAHVQTSA